MVLHDHSRRTLRPFTAAQERFWEMPRDVWYVLPLIRLAAAPVRAIRMSLYLRRSKSIPATIALII
jgi:hypothetical protein